jgi:hypothetical protein
MSTWCAVGCEMQVESQVEAPALTEPSRVKDKEGAVFLVCRWKKQKPRDVTGLAHRNSSLLTVPIDVKRLTHLQRISLKPSHCQNSMNNSSWSWQLAQGLSLVKISLILKEIRWQARKTPRIFKNYNPWQFFSQLQAAYFLIRKAA